MLDQAVVLLGGASLLDEPRRLAAMLWWSAVIWFLFEALNFRLQNWYYVFLPAGRAERWIGITVSLATVVPAVLLPERVLDRLGVWRELRAARRPRRPAPAARVRGRLGRPGRGARLPAPPLSADVGRGVARGRAAARPGGPRALALRRHGARELGPHCPAHGGGPVRGHPVGGVQRPRARPLDLHRAVPRAGEDLRNAPRRVPRLPALRARGVVSVPPAGAPDGVAHPSPLDCGRGARARRDGPLDRELHHAAARELAGRHQCGDRAPAGGGVDERVPA